MDRARILLACTLTFSVVLEFCVRYLDWWSYLWGHMDSFMHFWWGFNIFLALVVLLRWRPADALIGVFVFQMGWEAIEIAGDQLIPQVLAMLDPFYYDGVKDTIVDLMGGLVAWQVLILMKAKFAVKPSSLRQWMDAYVKVVIPGLIIGAIAHLWLGDRASLIAMTWIVVAAMPATLLARR